MRLNKIDNRRIFKNTLLLYIRMLLIMLVSFYTTRVILEVLGVTDYGIYNTIAGIVVLFGFLNTAMVTTTQRFLNYFLGKNDVSSAARSFSLSFFVHVIIGFLIIVFTEILGLTFLYTKMSLPPDRFEAALWTLHISVCITFVNTIRSPYNACIIAHERMNFYAYLSIVEVIAKLAIVYLLKYIDADKLILYSILLLLVSIITTFCYKKYCNKYFSLSKLHMCRDKKLLRELVNFSSFSIFGNAANVCTQQGLNMMLNVFTGVIVNAAVGIANQLSHGVYSLCSNFQLAFNPQIVKAYASGSIEEVKLLICRMSKLSYFLMFIITLPLLLFTEDYMSLWLGNVPQYATRISQLTLLFLLIDAVATPLWITVQASGNIRNYQIIIGLLVILNLPISYILLKCGFSPTSVFVVRIILNFVAYLFRYYYLTGLINFPLPYYIKLSILPILKVTCISILLAKLILYLNLNYILSSVLLILIIVFVIIMFGLNHTEQLQILKYIKQKI